MANILKMAKIHAIIGLLENKWPHRRIARELGVDRETVARYDRLRRSRESKPAIVATGSGNLDISNPAISTAGSEGGLFSDLLFPASGRSPGRPSECEPLRDIIKAKLEQGLSAQRIFQDVTSEHGFTGSYSSVKRFVQRLGASTPLPFRRMEPSPGTESQVDFGSGAWIIEGGKKRRSHVLRVMLSHSRKSYSEPVFQQTTENFRGANRGRFKLLNLNNYREYALVPLSPAIMPKRKPLHILNNVRYNVQNLATLRGAKCND